MADDLHGVGTVSRRSRLADPAASPEYSARLARLAAFTVHHKALVIGGWLAIAVVLALLFPQLETVVRQQSVDLIPGTCRHSRLLTA